MNICDDCESTTDVEPITDPWGGLHGYSCDNCNEERYEASLESYYGGSGPKSLDEQCAEALELKR